MRSNEKCIYGCRRCVHCDNYYPVDGEYNDEFVECLIECNKDEFMSEWYSYIEDYVD